MKRTLPLVFLLLLICSTAFSANFGQAKPSQPGSIGLSSSSYRSWCCNAYDNQPGLLKIYVYHVFSPGATASQFLVSTFYAPYLTYLGENSAFDVVIGNSQTGIAISYEACLTSPILLLEILYFGHGLTETCRVISVHPSPYAPSGSIEVVDCSDPPNILFASGGDLVINPDVSCGWWECYCDPDPVEQTNWGQIKSLYLGN
jgi:hypothetical protein